MAQEIQAHLIPAEPLEVPGARLCGQMESCREVGGDYFDYFALPDGAVGLARVKAAADAGRDYALALIDWQMPGWNGIETAERLQALQLAKLPKLILITAFGREEALHAARQAGFQASLIKPINKSVLFETIASVLGQSELQERRESMEAHIRQLLIPKDPQDGKDVIMEIRAGTGGDEASIFAGDLLRMYIKY